MIRSAGPDDIPESRTTIRELAAYERAVEHRGATARGKVCGLGGDPRRGIVAQGPPVRDPAADARGRLSCAPL
ncbi:hypothetical protein [Streptomyces afghaniensis]|uniref:hypothetical protein n=1 Tax=Streptomyces afghaniensis TaxID=66865 RepID=UPI002787F9ED|nr:hypothetical protein [Streptomyces afghaniensis]MDQ1021956.1 hypothetical protein [Streptomyces afghaniensis]